jgi:hypothetical protein
VTIMDRVIKAIGDLLNSPAGRPVVPTIMLIVLLNFNYNGWDNRDWTTTGTMLAVLMGQNWLTRGPAQPPVVDPS